ncbi:hypothetical protein, partial [Klebsiella pneumoniae]|uniref:hypothetical protein n=1 Tax=Klebsiella pneumoniae TaxID=573 RepID=UPI0013D0AD88
IVTDTVSCNKIDSISKTITINSGAKAAFVYNPQPPQANTAVNFINQSTNAASYKWLFGDGDSLQTNNTNT